MAAQRPKPYTISWPFTPKTAEDIDQSFDILFKQVQLNAPGAGVLPVSLGGTGLGSFVKGDLLYASTASTIAGLADIATGSVLLSGGVNTPPSYGKVGLTTHVSGVLPEANGGTNQSTYAQGDLLYASAADTLAKLAKNTTATRYLSNTGTSNNPAWAQVNLANGVTGTLPATNGGTGQNTYGVGDLLTANTTTTLARVPAVATGNALISAGTSTTPTWGKIGLTTHVSDVLPVANGGTNRASYSQGDILYASGVTTLAVLGKDTNATRYLSNTGTSNNPAWAQIDLSNGVTSTLPVANGGTNLASYTSGDLIYATGATTLAKLAIGAANRVLRSDGSAPNWGQVSDAYISDVTEAKITDGAILARVAALETITGNWIIQGDWTFTGAPVFEDATFSAASAIVKFIDSGGGTNEQRWRFIATSETFALQALSDNEATANGVFTVSRSGASITGVLASPAWTFGSGVSGNATNGFNCGAGGIAGMGFAEAGTPTGALYHTGGNSFWDADGSLFVRTNGGGTTRATLTALGTLTIPGAPQFTGTISPAALASGNTNNYAPTGHADAFMFRLSANAGGSTLTGLTAPSVSGRMIMIVNVTGGTLTISFEDTNSTAANRFAGTGGGGISIFANEQRLFFYDGTSQRWRYVI